MKMDKEQIDTLTKILGFIEDTTHHALDVSAIFVSKGEMRCRLTITIPKESKMLEA